jgi:tetratricopeptide (TPR) repeat protein
MTGGGPNSPQTGGPAICASSGVPQATRRDHAPLLIGVVLAVAVLAVYSRLAGADFINFDDNAYVYENRHVRAGLTAAGILWAFTTFDFFYWTPLTWLSHMLDCQLFGLNAGWHHLTSVFWHMLNSLLVFLIFRRMTGAVWRSAVVAGLFALHPLRVESVSWIAERKDVLSGFWLLCTLWAYVRYTEKPSNRRYGIVLLTMLLGLMSKPMLVTVPLLLLVLDYWPLRRRAFVEKVPLVILAAMSGLITLVGQYRMGAVALKISLAHRISNAAMSYARYLGKTIWPEDLAILYPYPKVLPPWQVAGAAALLITITIVFLRLRRDRPYLLAGWVWFLVGLVPAIGLVQVGRQPMADRFTYVPLIGIFVALVWGADAWLGGRPRTAAAIAGAALVLCAVRSWDQVATWRSSVTVFSHALAVAAPTGTAHRCLGRALETGGDVTGALRHYEAALEVEPANFVAHYDYGWLLLRLGRLDEASLHLNQVVHYCPTCAEPYYRLGQLSIRSGRAEEGQRWISQALARGLKGEEAASARRELAAIGSR